MAAPVFTRPMYEALRDHYQEFLVPGLEEIPPNTITLVATNPAFVEAFMVGLNHEMARKLLWREYPTDQRGTYFKRFWGAHERHRSHSGLRADRARITRRGRRGGASRAAWCAANCYGAIRPRSYTRSSPAADRTIRSSTTRRIVLPIFRGSLKPDFTFIGFAAHRTHRACRDRGQATIGSSSPSIRPSRASGCTIRSGRNHWARRSRRNGVTWAHVARTPANWRRLRTRRRALRFRRCKARTSAGPDRRPLRARRRARKRTSRSAIRCASQCTPRCLERCTA